MDVWACGQAADERDGQHHGRATSAQAVGQTNGPGGDQALDDARGLEAVDPARKRLGLVLRDRGGEVEPVHVVGDTRRAEHRH